MPVDKRPYVANLDFDEVKQDIIQYFQGRPEFKDYNYTGSSLNMLIDILAYNAHYHSLAANFLVNEMFLDSALLRNSVVSIAKQLNYTPRSARSASVRLTLTVPRLKSETFTLIPAGSKFITSAADTNTQKSFVFNTLEDNVVQFEPNERVKTIEVTVFEGQIATTRHVGTIKTIEQNRFLLDVENIDETSVRIRVNEISYTRVTPEKEGSLNLNDRSRVYWLEENRNRTLDLVFGNGVIGKQIEVGDNIIASYLISSGSQANGVSKFYANVTGRADIRVLSVDGISQGGSEPEKIREIKDNAPHWYQSQYRAVTTNDYEAIVRKNYADIQSVNVYGGDEIGRPGFVYIAIKPKSADALTDSAKTALLSQIVRANNVVTVRPQIVDPLVIKLILKTVVIYDASQTAFGAELLKAQIQRAFEIINTTYVGEFMQSFRESNLSYEIRNLDDSIVSSNTRAAVRVDQTVTNGKLQFNEWSFGNRIFHPEGGYKADAGGVFYTNTFTRLNKTRNSGFDDDGYGNIRMYDLVETKKIYVAEQAGTINYETGEIEILTQFSPDDGQIISFTALPDSSDIHADKNSVLQIATDQSLVQMIEKNETALIKTLNLTRTF